MDCGIPRLVIGGTSSGVGKTTFSMGLMAALHRRGLRVQPFKVGPDYIDPSYHQAATGVPSRNLDSWMVPREALLELLARACRGADVAVVEGVMGVFDGFSGREEAGSTAQIAKWLNAPALLLINAGKMARSAGAMALGYARFDPALRVAGFVLNNVAGETHYGYAREAIEATGVGPVLGYLPRDARMVLPERHLGLVPTPERALPEGFLDRLVGLVEAHLDVEAILKIARSAVGSQLSAISYQQSAAGPEGAVPSPQPSVLATQSPALSPLFPAELVQTRATIAVAQDEAFNFYYQDNLDLLEAHGARLLPFSPLRDRAIPPEADALYLGGGFPEVHASRLSANGSMLESVRRAGEAGMPLYAECGGLMYLTQGIVDGTGTRHTAVGLLPGYCSMEGSRLHLAYVEVSALRATPLGPAGTLARGHEFHWSRWEGLDPDFGAYLLTNRSNRIEGYARGSLLASFVHLHFGANPALAPAFVESARAYREAKR
ncbi:MAG: cobyrinate a,c-diamide synthase [Chloroflexi bacterium]|nr:cobyrinate a,c-diamide synthase [Chloroflexota bacterium]